MYDVVKDIRDVLHLLKDVLLNIKHQLSDGVNCNNSLPE